MRERFVQDQPFSTVLIGLARFADAAATKLVDNLPVFLSEEEPEASNTPGAARRLLTYIEQVERTTHLVAWWESHRQSFVDSWTALRA